MQPTNDSQSASETLSRLLDEWKKLTEAEKESIALEDWEGLENLQSKKVVFQRLIEDAEHSLFEGEASSCAESKEAAKRHFKRFTEELLQLEEANREFLAQKLATADAQRQRFDKTIRSLRHVQQAYGVGSRSFWHAYS
ncbi:MAG: hypothetical protein AAB393_07675 [Bacteroidota bacterium]